MSFMNGNSFADRQAAAAKARKAMAEKFVANSKYDPNDPVVVEREAKRKAILEARALRDIERAKRKAEQEAADAARKAAEEAARQEQLRLEALARRPTRRAAARRAGEAGIREEARARRALRRPQGAQEEEEIRLRAVRLTSAPIVLRANPVVARPATAEGARGRDDRTVAVGRRRPRRGRERARSPHATAEGGLRRADGPRMRARRL